MYQGGELILPYQQTLPLLAEYADRD
jgi:hypothetical protein